MSYQSASFLAQDIFSIPGRGEVIVGTLKEGKLAIGMRTAIHGNKAIVKMIEVGHHEVSQILELGAHAGILLTNIKKGDIAPG